MILHDVSHNETATEFAVAASGGLGLYLLRCQFTSNDYMDAMHVMHPVDLILKVFQLF